MSLKPLSAKSIFLLFLLLLVETNISIILDLPFLRQIFGFLFLTFLPGILILQILRINKIGITEKFVLSVGLSISFVMFFGLIINNLSLSIGYQTPLSTIFIMASFDIAFIILAIVGYKKNKDAIFSLPKPSLSKSEKIFLILSVLFPSLSIFGIYVMNTSDNNIILIGLMLLISASVIFIILFSQKSLNRFYPVIIFSIGISSLLLLSLRLNHIIGEDVNLEYFYFQTTLNNLNYRIIDNSTLNSSLSISLLPSIYQSILNINPEFLFKILYSVFFSISPLSVYVISKKYIRISYAFLASFFFISQLGFLSTPMLARTNMAVLFFILMIMVLFHDSIDNFNKKILVIIFIFSSIISHYSTSYIFFFIMIFTWTGMQILIKLLANKRKIETICLDSVVKDSFQYRITLTQIALFLAAIFFWYSQITKTPFNAGVSLIQQTFINMNHFFLVDSRGDQAMQAMGKGVSSIPQMIKFVIYWLTIAYIGIGVLYSIVKHKKIVSIFGFENYKKENFLKSKIDVEYFIISFIGIGILIFSFLLPFVLKGYDMSRIFFQMTPLLSMFFVIGGIALAKFYKSNHYHAIILIPIISLFLCTTGVVDIPFDVTTKSVTLSSEGFYYDYYRIYDQDIYAGNWLKINGNMGNRTIYTDIAGRKLVSQASIPWGFIDNRAIFDNATKINGYIYLRYYNVVKGWLLDGSYINHNIIDFRNKFIEKDLIYNNGGSEVWN